jgi:hypothetical protein
MAEVIPDDALAIRGGRNRPEDFERGTSVHPSGVEGVSVECAVGVPVHQLAASLPHRQIGVTTVGAIRALGGDVLRTSGRSAHHATLVRLSPQDASSLFTPTVANRSKKA